MRAACLKLSVVLLYVVSSQGLGEEVNDQYYLVTPKLTKSMEALIETVPLSPSSMVGPNCESTNMSAAEREEQINISMTQVWGDTWVIEAVGPIYIGEMSIETLQLHKGARGKLEFFAKLDFSTDADNFVATFGGSKEELLKLRLILRYFNEESLCVIEIEKEMSLSR